MLSAIYRQEVRPFTDKQIELVTNFAAQAVIAIENTRLLNELRESLAQQTATADVLKVISSSPGELEPVFQAMLENATRICGADFGTLFHFDGKAFDFAAALRHAGRRWSNSKSSLGHFCRNAGSLVGRVLQTRQVAHTADYAAEPIQAPPVKLGGARSTVAVPMLKDNELVGTIVIYRQEVRPFSRQADRAGAKLRRRRPSSPSRTRGCSTNCANRWRTRPRPPTFSLRSAGR